MATKKTTTEVATAGTFTLDKVPAALEAVNKQIKAIKGSTEENRTNGHLDGFGDIFKEKNANNLIKAYSSVNGREKAFKEAAKEMGIDPIPEFKINGSSAKAWKDDLKKAYNMATAAAKLKKLEKVKAELEKHLSEEDKLSALMGNLADIMS